MRTATSRRTSRHATVSDSERYSLAVTLSFGCFAMLKVELLPSTDGNGGRNQERRLVGFKINRRSRSCARHRAQVDHRTPSSFFTTFNKKPMDSDAEVDERRTNGLICRRSDGRQQQQLKLQWENEMIEEATRGELKITLLWIWWYLLSTWNVGGLPLQRNAHREKAVKLT